MRAKLKKREMKPAKWGGGGKERKWVRGLTTHILNSGPPTAPLILLLHGFPELSYSRRKVLPLLSSTGDYYHVVAPDARGFGRTTGWDDRPFHAVDLHTFSTTALVRDVVLLVHALGYTAVECVVGHDAGAVTAAMCAVVRPDLFRGVVLLSHPFNGMPEPQLPRASATGIGGEEMGKGGAEGAKPDVHAALAGLGRKHHKWYYSTEGASAEMMNEGGRGGLAGFLRGKLAQMPGYYVMPVECTMPEAVEREMVGAREEGVERCRAWLTDEELGVYVGEYRRTGFQGALNWYRVRTAKGARFTWDYDVFADRKIDVPCAFVSGLQDWGIYQEPGAFERMRDGSVCSDFREMRLVDGVGHWAPQECPEEVVEVVLGLVRGLDG
ncbi:alpha/beta-hydrolase [Aspergillus ellipticus CBS 707.79]|uniref:Alpha/beta-hydrolase n=1 Tax=Aspergillus ellipticus CBS 707.79 TaxID=1448320 RepID=A0A319DME6_9EURO|nr:alpha/beta-hydrolase [Aspergillus ellipticus CBS 707.79]